MTEIRNLTRNGETFYPLTHNEAVIGMNEFKETIVNQVAQYKPIEITGDVTNAPDEEDITSDSNNLLKFKDRNNLYGLGKVILRRDKTFSAQVTLANTIYVVQYNFDLNNGRVVLPLGAILLFEGGSINNGTLVGNGNRLVYYQELSEIMTDLTLEGTFVYKACDKDTIGSISVDNSSIEENELGQLSVKDNGIQNTHLNGNVVDQVGLVLDSNNKISLKNNGVTNLSLNSSVVDDSGIGLNANNKISIKTSGVQGINLNSNIVNTDDLVYDNTNHNIKFADREYNSLSPNGMGRVILRNNIVNGVNTLTQSMINQINTIYIIRYDFTLGEDITVPENCILEFEGGSVSGEHTVTGNNTKIKANKRIFDNNVAFAGTWNCSQIESYWWDIRENDSTYDNAPSLQKGIDLASLNYGGIFHISGGKLYVDIRITDHSYIYWFTQTGTLQMKSGVHVVMDSGTTIKAIDNTETHYTIFMFFNIENASIEGGNIKGDVDTNAGAKSSEFGYGIAIFSANNITIKNVNISYCHGDGIMIGRHYDMDKYPEDRTNFTMIPHNIKIFNCDISYNGRQGISVCGAIDSIISDCFIYGIGNGGYGTNPKMAIDVEPNPSLNDEKVENLLIEGIKSKLNAQGTITVMGDKLSGDFYNVKNVRIANCACNQTESYNLRLYNAHDTIVTNCSFGTIFVQGTYTLTDAPTQIFNCYSNSIVIDKGTNAVSFVGCTVYGDFWNNSIVFLGNNSYISFMNCSVYQMDTRECLRYVDSDDSGALTYDNILYLNCSFGYANNGTIDSTHATYVNNASGVVKRFR